MRRRLRVAITLEQCWHRVPGGTAGSIVDLTRALAARDDLDLFGVSAFHRGPPAAPFEPPVPVRSLHLPRRVLYETWHALRWPPVERATGPVDVVHATAVAVPATRAPLVVTVHDLAFLSGPGEVTGHGRRFFRRGTDLARRHAALVLCPSRATMEDCVAAGFDADRLRLVPWGVTPRPAAAADVERVRTTYGLSRDYVLFVGTVEPRKNLATVIDAFGRLGSRDLDLALVGPRGWNEDLGRRIAPLGGRARPLGFVPAADLPALYAGCAAFCYPSRSEGFGLPVLEAMAHGAPVVTSAGTATAEVAGDAGLLVEPADPAAVGAALARVLDEPGLADDLRTRGRTRAATFTWERSAELTAAAYQEVADGRSPVPVASWRASRSPVARPSGRPNVDRDRPARVGVNLLWLVPGAVGGTEEYTARLLGGLAERFPPDLHVTLLVLGSFAAAHPELVAAYPTVALDIDGRRRPLRVAAESTWLPRTVRSRRLDLVHHAGGVVPPIGGSPAILTIHDLQPLLMPEHFSPVKRWYLRTALPRSAQAARLVVTPSDTAGRDVVEHLGVAPGLVRTVPHGIAPVGPPAPATERAIVRGRYGLADRRFFLFPAVTWRHKNHQLVVRALAKVVAAHPDAVLVLCGAEAEAEEELTSLIGRLDLASHVRRAGRVPRRDLDVLMEEATALTFPSLFEGFGAPVVEAMARGCPVIAADATALPEVVGGAGLLVDPTDVEGWAAAMTMLLEDGPRRASLVAAGRRRAGDFTWERAAAALAEAYREALR